VDVAVRCSRRRTQTLALVTSQWRRHTLEEAEALLAEVALTGDFFESPRVSALLTAVSASAVTESLRCGHGDAEGR